MTKKNGIGQRIELDGGYVVMRPMNIDALLAFAEADINMGPAIRAVKDGCIEDKFKNGKPLGEQEIDVLTAILRGWNRAEDEVALPPASAPPSASPSTGR
jgi:hypothetical protein